jgi:hypothetical protein
LPFKIDFKDRFKYMGSLLACSVIGRVNTDKKICDKILIVHDRSEKNHPVSVHRLWLTETCRVPDRGVGKANDFCVCGRE